MLAARWRWRPSRARRGRASMHPANRGARMHRVSRLISCGRPARGRRPCVPEAQRPGAPAAAPRGQPTTPRHTTPLSVLVPVSSPGAAAPPTFEPALGGPSAHCPDLPPQVRFTCQPSARATGRLPGASATDPDRGPARSGGRRGERQTDGPAIRITNRVTKDHPARRPGASYHGRRNGGEREYSRRPTSVAPSGGRPATGAPRAPFVGSSSGTPVRLPVFGSGRRPTRRCSGPWPPAPPGPQTRGPDRG
jgi:hypothetical protein